MSYSLDRVDISHESIARAEVQELLSIAGQDERQAHRETLLRCSHLHRRRISRCCYHAPYGYVLLLLRRLRHSSHDVARLAWERCQSQTETTCSIAGAQAGEIGPVRNVAHAASNILYPWHHAAEGASEAA